MTEESSVSPGPDQASGDRTSLGSEAPLLWRKRPVVIEAVQYGMRLPMGPFDPDPVEWIDEAYNSGVLTNMRHRDGSHYLAVETLEGTIRAQPGDWIIKGVSGELYPCKPDIFAMTYEPVGGSSPPSSDPSPTSGRAPK